MGVGRQGAVVARARGHADRAIEAVRRTLHDMYKKGELPTPQEYLDAMKTIDPTAADTYRYLNFDQLPEFTEAADFALDAEAEDEAKAIAA